MASAIATAPAEENVGSAKASPPGRHIADHRRILAVNLLALAFLFAGMLYLDEYRRGLIAAELATMRSEANLFAAAIGESATLRTPRRGGPDRDDGATDGRRVVETSALSRAAVREDGSLVADSLLLGGPGGGVQIEELPAPAPRASSSGTSSPDTIACSPAYGAGRTFRFIPRSAVQTARDYPEVLLALSGEPATTVRSAPNGGMVLSVAVPVQRYKQVLAALMMTKGSSAIDAALLKVTLGRLEVVHAGLGRYHSVVYLPRSHDRSPHPAAGHRRRACAGIAIANTTIPTSATGTTRSASSRPALRDMTQALWLRIDAIERFAADVAHELKNPLTSLRSAVETAARINDPDRRQKLMNIILDDVGRLDRLISDISDASRLDAELSRENPGPWTSGRCWWRWRR